MNRPTVSNIDESTRTRLVTLQDLARTPQCTPANDDAPPPADDLIIKLRAHSRSAASEMYRRFAPSMLRVARKRTSAADAEDIVQQAMLIVLTANKVPDTVDGLRRWLHGVVYRLVGTNKSHRAGEVLVDADLCILDPRCDFDPLDAARDEDES